MIMDFSENHSVTVPVFALGFNPSHCILLFSLDIMHHCYWTGYESTPHNPSLVDEHHIFI